MSFKYWYWLCNIYLGWNVIFYSVTWVLILKLAISSETSVHSPNQFTFLLKHKHQIHKLNEFSLNNDTAGNRKCTYSNIKHINTSWHCPLFYSLGKVCFSIFSHPQNVLNQQMCQTSIIVSYFIDCSCMIKANQKNVRKCGTSVAIITVIQISWFQTNQWMPTQLWFDSLNYSWYFCTVYWLI